MVDSTYQLRTVANGSSTVIADLASATIGGTQYRNYRTVGPYLLASLVGVAGATKTPLSATALASVATAK